MTKKAISIILSILLIISALPIALAYDSTKSTVLMIESKEVSDTETGNIEVQFVLSNAPEIKSFSLTGLNYDKSKMSFVKGICNAENVAISNILPTGNAVVALNENTDINGAILTYIFKLAVGAVAGDAEITANFSAKTKPIGGIETLIESIEIIPGKITVIGSHTHKFIEQVKNESTLKSEATCLEDAVYYYSCECGEVSISETFKDVGSKLYHTGGEATCTNKAVCDRCHEEYGEINAANHKNIVTDKAVAATCTETGLTEGSHCADCKAVLVKQEVIEKLPHNPVWADNAVAPTCEKDGKEADTICSECKTIIKYGDVISALGHKWEEAERAEATCEEDGSITYICVNDASHTKTETIPASGHIDENNDGKCDVCDKNICKHESVSIVNAKAATCTEAGYTGDKVCDKCGVTLEKGKEIEKLQHTVVIDEAKPATCMETGLTEGSHCADCNAVLVKQEVIERLPHNPVSADNAVAPTCEKDGKEADIICSECGETLSNGVVIPATNHAHKKLINIKEATCSAEGYTGDTYCEDCKTIIEYGKKIDKLSHTVKTVNKKEATCMETGYTGDVICEVCNETISTGEVIAKLPHTPISADNAVAPTCTAEGKEADVICDVCGTILEIGKVLPALDHSWKEVSRTEATCEADGSIEYVCENDSAHKKTEVITAKGHIDENNDGVCDVCENNICKHESISIVNVKAATCTEAGYTGDKVCDKCGVTIEKGKEIEKLAHTVVIDKGKPATCTEYGFTEGSHCSECGTVIKVQEVIAAVGHTEKAVSGKPATCTDDGLTDGKVCAVCGSVLEEQKVIKKLGHKVVTDEAKPATCTETGLTEGTHCSRCSKIIKEQIVVPATGHAFGDWAIASKPTCTEDGLEIRKCEACSEEEHRIIPSIGFTDADGDGDCDECGKTEEEHETDAPTYSSFAKKLIINILRILEIIFRVLDMYIKDGPFAELLEAVKEMQKVFKYVQ